MPSFAYILLLAGTVASLALPTALITYPPTNQLAPTSSISSISCDIRYCDGSTSWCHYWAGITSYDPTLGPLPGETRTSLGLCGKTISSATYTATPTPSSTPVGV
jgi:hypothetical protein